MATIEDLRPLLLIDKDDLDTALLQQPDLFFRIAENYADAISIRDRAYENVKRVDADLGLSIRQQLEDDGEKVTEAKVTALVLSDTKHIQAIDEHLEAKKQAEEWASFKEAFQQRGYVLRELVELHALGYFGATNAQKPNRKEKFREERRRALSASKPKPRRRIVKSD